MSIYQRYPMFLTLLLPLVALPAALEGQEPPQPPQPPVQQQAAPPAITDAKLEVFVKVYLGKARIQDRSNDLLAAVRNKTDEAQELLREQRREETHALYEEHGMAEQEYNWIQFIVSSNEELRTRFEELVEAAREGGGQP